MSEYRRLFPNGVPLRGPLTAEQQAWLRPTRRTFPQITREPADDGMDLTLTPDPDHPDNPDRMIATLTERTPA